MDDSLGNVGIFNNYKVAFFCSRFCPPELITKIYDWSIMMREEGKTIISGFHTPIEQDVLKYLLKGKQPIIISPARNVQNMRIPSNIKNALNEGRILYISPLTKYIKRQTRQTAIIRNEFIANLADEIVIGHTEPGGNIDTMMKKIKDKKITFI